MFPTALRWTATTLAIAAIASNPYGISAVASTPHGVAADEGNNAANPQTPTTLVVADPVHHLDADAREPMLVEHPDGTLFVAGYGRDVPTTEQAPRLWKSADGGSTWSRVNVGTVAEGAKGNSDVDLAVAGDGTLYFITMGFDRSVSAGTHVAVGVSNDVGATWSWTYLSRDPNVDRPWIKVTPGGTVHAIWNDGSGVSHAVSADGGRSWAPMPKIHPRGGSSHLAVGPAGELAVRITPVSASGQQFDEDVELLAVSIDDGRTWQKHAPPGERDWSPDRSDRSVLNRWVEPLAWDNEGALYYLWSEGHDLRLGRSSDLGATWETWSVANDDEAMLLPYLIGRGSGELAATWFSGEGGSLKINVATIEIEDAGGEPRVLRAAPLQQDAWVMDGGVRTRDTAGEYVPVAFLSDGDLGVVTPIQNGPGGRGGFTWWRIVRP